jgi:predicted DNA-binding transcriptional regulator AlpA
MDRRLTTELDELTRRFDAMPRVDQYEFARRVELLLNLEQPLLNDEAVKRRETLADLRRAMSHLALARPLTKDEYEAVQRELGLDWSWQRIFRLWRSWDAPTRAAAGATPARGWQERDFRRRFLSSRPARTTEEYFAALRLWLENDPPTTTAASYDQFAREHNLQLSDGGLPLPIASTLVGVLGLRFSDLVKIARGEQAYPDVVRVRRDNTDWSRGPDDLIGMRTIGFMSGRTPSGAQLLTREGDFPRPVMLVGGRRIWLRDEVARYLAGEVLPLGELDRLRERYLTRDEAAALLAISPSTLRQVDTFPRHVAKVGRDCLWLREEVEGYAALYEREVARRKSGPRRKGRRSEFLTLASLTRELELSDFQTRRLLAEVGFPPPVRRFGGGGVWSRSSVEAYLAGNPLPSQSAIGDLLDTTEVEELLAHETGYRKSRALELPPAVARIKGANVYLRAEVEAMLDDPAVQERLERRRRWVQPASRSSSQASVSSGDG